MVCLSERTDTFQILRKYFSLGDNVCMAPVPLRDLVMQLDARLVEELTYNAYTDLSDASPALVSFFLHREASLQDVSTFQTMVNENFAESGGIEHVKITIYLCRK